MQDVSSMFVSASDSIKIWDSDRMNILKQYNGENLSTGSNFKDVAWNHNNTLLAGVSNGSGVVLFDHSRTGDVSANVVRELSKSKEQTSLCFSDGKLFCGSATGDISIWDCDSGKNVKTFKSGHKSPVRRLDKMGGGRIVSACNSGEIIIWLVESGVAQMKLEAPKSKSVRGLEHSPWDRTVLGTTSDDGAVYIWDTERQATKYSFTLHDAPAMDLSFSQLNHLLLASCGLDKKVTFYDIQGNNVVKTITSPQPLTAVCFLSNGVHVCAGTSMGNIYKYDLRKPDEPLNSIQAHSTSVQRLLLQTIKKPSRKEKRPSRTESTNYSTQQKVSHVKDELKPPPHHPAVRTKSSSRSSHDLAKNRKSWSKVSEAELPIHDSKIVNGEPSPVKSIPNRKSQLEKSLGLQTPLNRSNASSRRDTLGSYCEGIFSPVANMNESAHRDPYVPQSKTPHTNRGDIQPANRSIASSQRDTLGSYCEGIFSPVANMNESVHGGPYVPHSQTQHPRQGNIKSTNPYSSFNFNTPAVQKLTGHSLQDKDNAVNGGPKNNGDRGSVTEDLTNISLSFSQIQKSTPANPTTVSTSSFSPGSEGISEQLHHENEDTSVTTLVNGNIPGPSSAGFQQTNNTHSNAFQYQLNFLQNTVRELVEEHEDNVRDEIRHLHMQTIKMFAEQNERMRQLAEQCSVNPLLLQEIERLRTENDKLRRKF